MARLELYLFGTPRIALDSLPLSIRRRKAVALLTYLAITERPHHRDALASFLFPEYNQTGARENFRRILSSLHKALDHQWLQIDRVNVALPRRENLWMDIHHFRHLIDSVRRHDHAVNEPCTACLAALEEAAALYADDFLSGFTLPDSPDFDDWQRSQSMQLRGAFREVLEQLGWGYAAQDLYPHALGYARRCVELDPLHEPAHRQLMQLYAQAGQQTEALRQYAACVQLLQDELDVPPSPETISLMQAIKTGQIQASIRLVGQSRKGQMEIAHPEERPVKADDLNEADTTHALPAFLTTQSPPSIPEKSIFVARSLQLMQLRKVLHRVLAGQGQAVFITGESGSGKTALLAEFVRYVQEVVPELIVVSSVCNAYTGIGDPYRPFREIMAMLTGDVESRWLAGVISREQAVRLWRLLPDAIRILLDEGPNLIDTFVLSSALISRAQVYQATNHEWFDRLQAYLTLDQQQRADQSRLFEEFTWVLRALATSRPLLLVLDDLHWADVSSLSLLFYLGRHLADRRILIVSAYRPEEIALGWRGEPHPLIEILSEFQRQYGHIYVSLDTEASAEGRHFVDALLDVSPNRLDEAFRQALFRQSGGLALFTHELLSDLKEQGALVQDETGKWMQGRSLEWQGLPTRVEGAIAKRIERLDAKLREILSVASVAGEDFIAEVVAHVLALDERQLVHLLSRELDRRHRLVQVQEVRYWRPRPLSLYRFRHNLFQTYLYHSLDQAEQMYLHEAVGAALIELYGEQQEQLALIAAQLAHHFQCAGRIEQALEYRLLAGEQAVQVAANQEAIDHFETGLALLLPLPDTPDRAQQELRFQLALGIPVTALRGYGHTEVERVYRRAHELGIQLGETGQLFPALYGLCRMSGFRGELQAAQRFGHQLMELAQSTQDQALLLEAYRTNGISNFHLGELDAARNLFDQGLALYEPTKHQDHAFLYGHDPAVSCLGYLSQTLWLLGFPVQAQEKAQELLQIAQRLSHPFSLCHAYIVGAAILHQLRREGQEVQRLASVGINLAEEHAFPIWQAMGTVMFGWSLTQQGQIEAGIHQMSQGIAEWQAGKAQLFMPYFLGLLADGYRQAGQLEEATTNLINALAMVEQTGEGWYEAELYRLHGEMCWRQDAPLEEVETRFQKALSVAREQQSKSFEFRAAMSLSRLWQTQSKVAEARSLLTESYGCFSEGFDTPDLQEARALLDALRRDHPKVGAKRQAG